MPETPADYIIEGGLIVSGSAIARSDLAVKNGLISEIGPDLSGTPSARTVDASGKYVLPGIIDAHNHPVNTDKIDTFSVSAAFGGITTVIPFIQNLRGHGISGTTLDTVHAFIEEAERTSCLDFGVHWAEQMLPVVYEEGVNKGRITLTRLVQVMCENPAKIFGLYPRKGVLQPGSDADLVLFDPALQHTLSAASQHCLSDFTMFEGKEVLGKPVFSMQRGEVLIEDGELKRPPGNARFLPGNSDLAVFADGGHRIT